MALNKEKVKDHVASFWDFISNTKGVMDLDTAFFEWAKKAEVTVDEFKYTWAYVNYEINKKFGIKQGGMELKFDTPEEFYEFYNKQDNDIGVSDPTMSEVSEELPESTDLPPIDERAIPKEKGKMELEEEKTELPTGESGDITGVPLSIEREEPEKDKGDKSLFESLIM